MLSNEYIIINSELTLWVLVPLSTNCWHFLGPDLQPSDPDLFQWGYFSYPFYQDAFQVHIPTPDISSEFSIAFLSADLINVPMSTHIQCPPNPEFLYGIFFFYGSS